MCVGGDLETREGARLAAHGRCMQTYVHVHTRMYDNMPFQKLELAGYFYRPFRKHQGGDGFPIPRIFCLISQQRPEFKKIRLFSSSFWEYRPKPGKIRKSRHLKSTPANLPINDKHLEFLQFGSISWYPQYFEEFAENRVF